MAQTEEAGYELLLCARYGELDEMRELVESGAADINFADDMGVTAMHRAAANNHVDCLRWLIRHGATYKPNDSGNTPLHWAVQNKAKESVFLLLDKVSNVDVLAQNDFGKSILTDAFNAEDQDILARILQHDSASSLEQEAGQAQNSTAGAETSQQSAPSESTPSSDATSAEASDVIQSHTHQFRFSPADSGPGNAPIVRVREVATDWFGKVFNNSANEDTTGIQLWAASLVFARWLVDSKADLEGRTVCELGAGCGLPGLVAFFQLGARKTVLTDVFSHTLDNLRHNVEMNMKETPEKDKHAIAVEMLDWKDPTSWEPVVQHVSDDDEAHAFDVLLGCDLVYDTSLVEHLVAVVKALLKPNGVFFYVSGGKRKGAKEFVQQLRQSGFDCEIVPMKEDYKANPLFEGTEVDLEMHFNELYENTQTLLKFRRSAPGCTP